MRILIAVILMAGLAVSCSNKNENKVIYMVRHAEKDVVPNNNPPLSTDGVIRSVDLTSWFKDIEIDTIFSTDFLRTRETVKPVAEAKGLELSVYKAKDFEGFAENLKEMKADTILIVGHSNTILEQIEAFGLERPQEEIKENEYDKIFEIRVDAKKVITHTYGTKFKE
ncbi:Histidine phosphatase superfamily (branch 1) [Marivirga sericea]|uniref:Histidine phosphatase superfamily (Branch 1) n=1 Tax=Marivirga sericea TaxID=1028 RepID=A0A1X7LBM2_9BACT|nr:phosphoglycerate mutase family protein [Marivirga sericea]SMG50569.1 Histidine phosphatase superfamily (branch 1) [Marivirga sericea]